MRKRDLGFTLIELLIVVAIIGILAAIAIPNLLTAMQRAKQKRTMADMRAVAAAWEAHAIDHDSYSASGAQVDDGESWGGGITIVPHQNLVSLLAPTYMKSLPKTDGWSRNYIFALDSADSASQYGIISVGKDGAIESTYVAGTQTSDFDCDIVYVSGAFIQWPEGLQGGGTGSSSPQQDTLLMLPTLQSPVVAAMALQPAQNKSKSQ